MSNYSRSPRRSESVEIDSKRDDDHYHHRKYDDYERDRDRERDRYSRSNDDGYYRRRRRSISRERERERDRDRERDRRASRRHDYDDDYESRRERRRRDRDEERRYSRSKRSKSPITTSPDNTDSLESEQRSVFVSQLSARTTSNDLGKFFEENLGKNTIADARIVMDKNSRRSKGIGYVELKSSTLLEKALEMTGKLLMGIPMIVQMSEADKNRQARATSSAASQSAALAATTNNNGTFNTANDPTLYKLYVGSINFSLNEDDVRSVFEPFGELDNVHLGTDDEGRSRGHAFIKYKRIEDAKMAAEQMNNFYLAGRHIRVYMVNHYGSTVKLPEASIESDTVNLNSISRHQLMQNLARSHEKNNEKEIEEKRKEKEKKIPEMMTKGVLLKNMFNAEEETEENWEKDLGEDVKMECESKYGKILEIGVDKETNGEIVIKFESVEGASKAIEGLNGRWFGGRKIEGEKLSDRFLVSNAYNI